MAEKNGGRSRKLSGGTSTSRRNILKGALLVLGADMLVQPNGGVSGSAFASSDTKQKSTGAAQSVSKTGSKTGDKSSPNFIKKSGTEKSGAPLKNASKTMLKYGPK